MIGFKNRVIERVEMRVGDLRVNPRNPFMKDEKQQEELENILSLFGIVSSLIAYRSARNDGALTLFDGHQRRSLSPEQVWPVDITDLTDDEVDQIVLLFDESTGRGSRNMRELEALLNGIGDEYSGTALQGIVDDLSSLDFSDSLEKLGTDILMPDDSEFPLDDDDLIDDEVGYSTEDRVSGDGKVVHMIFTYPVEVAQEIKQALKEMDDHRERALCFLLDIEYKEG